jgi:hypothetical protein
MFRRIIFLLAFPFAIALAQADGLTLSCPGGIAKAEAALMKQAPSGARRIGEHTLVVNTKHGTKRYTDSVSDDEESLDGTRFQYCGTARRYVPT